MKRLHCFMIPLLMAFAFTSPVFAQTKITGIQARLFYNEKKSESGSDGSRSVAGTFSDTLINNAGFSLWNTPIGEGSAAGYSEQTIVTVEITSNGMSNKEQVLNFTAMEGKKILLKAQQKFTCIGDASKYYQLFALNNTGCQVITLKAEIMKNGKSISTMTRTIEFHCGE